MAGLGFRLSPLIEQALESERLLQHDALNLDVGLELPILVFVVRDCPNKLLLIEPRASGLLRLTQSLNLLLLVIAFSALRAVLANYLENLNQFFLFEIHAQSPASQEKIMLEYKTDVLIIVDLIRFLWSHIHLLDLLSELGHERVLLIR